MDLDELEAGPSNQEPFDISAVQPYTRHETYSKESDDKENPFSLENTLDRGPRSHVFHSNLQFSYFNGKTLSLKTFFNAVEGCKLGEDDELPDEPIFRAFIASYGSESAVPETEKNRVLRLYVLYLLSVHKDNDFVSACVDYVKSRPFEIRGFEILPIYLNLGCTHEDLTGSRMHFDYPVKFKQRLRVKESRRFPYFHLEQVADVLLYYANLGLIKKDGEMKILLRALSKVCMDRKITCSRILSPYSLLVSILSSQLATVYSHDDVVSCLHIKEEADTNKADFVVLVHMPIIPKLHELLLLRTINYMLNREDTATGDVFGMRYVYLVLQRMVQIETMSFDKVFSIFQLLNSSLPNITATELEARASHALVVHLQAVYATQGCPDWLKLQVEMVRLKLVIRNCVMKRTQPVYFKDITGPQPQ